MSDVITGSSTIAALFPSEVTSKQVAEALQAVSVIAGYVWIETESDSNVIKFGKLPAITPTSYTDTTGMALVGYSPTSASVTVAPVGSAVRITGIAGSITPRIVFDVLGGQGNGLGEKIDTDLAALFASVTASVGSTTTANSTTYFLAAIGKLNAAKVSQANRVAVFGPTGYNDLLASAQAANAFAFTQAAMSGQVGVLFGVPVEMSPVLATANSAADDVGCMFERKAFGLGMIPNTRTKIADAPVQFDATDIATSAYYGCALINTNRAVKTITRH